MTPQHFSLLPLHERKETDMNMQELAMEYRESAALIRGRITELKSELQAGGMCEMEKLRLRIRIETLGSIYREVSETAVFMEKYYDRRYKKNGRYTV